MISVYWLYLIVPLCLFIGGFVIAMLGPDVPDAVITKAFNDGYAKGLRDAYSTTKDPYTRGVIPTGVVE